MRAVVLDTETTGIIEPDVIELAYVYMDSPRDEKHTVVKHYFKPRKHIELGAMATHHIIDDDLKDCPLWAGSWSLPESADYLVGHSIDYDWQAIGRPDIKRICTLAMARRIYPSIDSHSLVAMMYHLYPHGLARGLVTKAHSAFADVDNTQRLLFALLQAIPNAQTWEDVWQFSEKARIPTVLAFGKHKGTPIKDVPPDYKRWLLKQDDVDQYLRQALDGEK